MQQKRKFGCGNYSLVGPVKDRLDRIGCTRLMCKTYGCVQCLPKKLRRMRTRIAQIASDLKLLKFVTLTLDPKKIPAGIRSERYLRETWRKMRVLLARRYGKSIPFIGVLEFQKSGVAHLHLLVGVYIPQDWLSNAWQSVGGGKIVDIRQVDIQRVVGYLTCYLTNAKVTHTLSLLPRRARIFTCSRSISFWGRKEKSEWWLCKQSIDHFRESAAFVENERWEPFEDLQPFGLEVLMYFELLLAPKLCTEGTSP